MLALAGAWQRGQVNVAAALTLGAALIVGVCLGMLLARTADRTEIAGLQSAVRGDSAGSLAGAPSLQIAQLQTDLATSQEWVAALQARLAAQQDDAGVLARAFAERDAAVAARDQAMAVAGSAGDGEAGPADPALALLAEQTRATIREVETIVASTGLDPNRLAPPKLPDRSRERGLPRGGPLVPVPAAAAASAAGLSADIERLQQLADLLRQMPLSAPIPVISVSSPFGVRVDPFTGATAMHEGVDLQGPVGTRVAATGAGVVVFAGWRPDYGEMVEIDHGIGLHTRYAHLSRVLVREGQTIASRQLVGLLGATGRATGPHLHYEVLVDGKPQNPVRFFKTTTYVVPRD